MIKTTSHIVRKIEEILMKRYAVEKVLARSDLFGNCFYAVASFLLFQGFLLAYFYLGDSNFILRISIESAALLILVLIWWRVWEMVGKIIPKFVLIGMLGWILITIGLVPNLFDGNGCDIHLPAPICRLISIEPAAHEIVNLDPAQCIDIFLAPGLILTTTDQWENNTGKFGRLFDLHSNYDYYIVLRYFVLLMAVVVLIDLLLTVSTYRRTYPTVRQAGQYLGFFDIYAVQREKEAKIKLFFLGLFLLILANISLNYFILFWIVSFIAAIFLFQREILERGKSHKPFSRAILFVILTQIFSSMCGEILLILFLPLYPMPTGGSGSIYLIINIILAWIIIIGSSVTVLIGIITQVIWSGRRMTDGIKS